MLRGLAATLMSLHDMAQLPQSLNLGINCQEHVWGLSMGKVQLSPISSGPRNALTFPGTGEASAPRTRVMAGGAQGQLLVQAVPAGCLWEAPSNAPLGGQQQQGFNH